MSKKSIVIAGGGTGGHISPAIAIAEALKRRDVDCTIQFVGASGALEEKMVPAAGWPLATISVGKLHRSVGRWAQLKTLFSLPRTFWQCWKLYRRFRPDLVLGVGGYASGPFVFLAALLGCRTVIWEPNAFPGLTNRILSRFVDQAIVVFDWARPYFKTDDIQVLGMPVRRSIEESAPMKKNDRKLHVFVFGGSQGARAINNAVCEMVTSSSLKSKDNVLIRHQTGRLDYQKIKQNYDSSSKKVVAVEVFDFIHDMRAMYEWADLVICRSGAATLAELAATQRPAILVPLPTAADDHQRKNAEVVVKASGAKMLLQQDLTPERLYDLIEHFDQQPEELEEMSKSIHSFYVPHAGDRIAQQLLKF